MTYFTMYNGNVKKRHSKIAFLTIPAILLAAAVAISFVITEDAFARSGKYTGDTTSQAAAVSNDCLNPILDSNTIDNMVGVGNCAGTVSQQDESGSAAAPITSQTANPDIELQRATTTPPETETPSETAQLRVLKIVECTNLPRDLCPSDEEFTMNVASSNPSQIRTFPGDEAPEVPIGRGHYEVTEVAPPTPPGVTFDGGTFSEDCSGDIDPIDFERIFTCIVTNGYTKADI